MSTSLPTSGAAASASGPSSLKTIITTTGTAALGLKKTAGNKMNKIGQRASKRLIKKTFNTGSQRTHSTKQTVDHTYQSQHRYISQQQHQQQQRTIVPNGQHLKTPITIAPISNPNPLASTSTRQTFNTSYGRQMFQQHGINLNLAPSSLNLRPPSRFFSTQTNPKPTTTTNHGYLTKDAVQKQQTTTSALFTALGPSGILASSALYLNITNDNGETVFTKAVELPNPEHGLSSQKLSQLTDKIQTNTKYAQIRSTTTQNDLDSDDDDQVLVIEIDNGTHLPTDAHFVSKKKHFSLDTAGRLSTQTETDAPVSSSDLAYASSQSATTQSSSSSESSKNAKGGRPQYGAQVITPTTPSQHYQTRTTTGSSQSSASSMTSGTDLSDTEAQRAKGSFDPVIIGAPPADFSHPLDRYHSPLYKFVFGLRRFCTIFWTFLPFIRHYVWTHQFHTPTAADRQQMLNNLSKCIEQSGCAFIKFGQWLSMRPDIFPQDVIEVLSRLRDGAPAHEFEETRQIIKDEFGMDINELFLSFDSEPVASGSIAQVYRGKLRPEHVQSIGLRDAKGNLLDEVAVKIRHPGVLKETWIDLDIIYAIVDHVPGLCIPFNKNELKLMIQYQIDFRFEGHYLSRFRHNFREEIRQGYIAFPYVSENSLRQSVLIESWAAGKTVGDIFTEVGDLFRPIVKINTDTSLTMAVPAHHYPPTMGETLRGAATGIASVLQGYAVNAVYLGTTLKSFGIDAVWKLADVLKINIDTFNEKHNFDYPASMPQTAFGKYLQSVLPPRGRVGEDKYVWDPKLSDEENRRAEQKKILAYTLFDMFAKMFLRDNLIHADLHAGNVLYDHASFKHTATVLDAGMTVALESDIMSQFELFLRAVCYGDPNSLVEACSRFEVNLPNANELSLLPPLSNNCAADFAALPIPNGSGIGLLATNSTVRDRFHHDINVIFQKFYGNSNIWGATESDNVSIGDVVGQVLLTMQTHGVILRGDVAASIMAMSVIEGLLRQLDPELDIVLNCLPYFIRYKRSPKN